MKSSKSLTMLLSDPAENQEEAEAEEEDEGKTSDFLITFKDVSLFYYPALVALPTQNEPVRTCFWSRVLLSNKIFQCVPDVWSGPTSAALH